MDRYAAGSWPLYREGIGGRQRTRQGASPGKGAGLERHAETKTPQGGGRGGHFAKLPGAASVDKGISDTHPREGWRDCVVGFLRANGGDRPTIYGREGPSPAVPQQRHGTRY